MVILKMNTFINGTISSEKSKVTFLLSPKRPGIHCISLAKDAVPIDAHSSSTKCYKALPRCSRQYYALDFLQLSCSADAKSITFTFFDGLMEPRCTEVLKKSGRHLKSNI